MRLKTITYHGKKKNALELLQQINGVGGGHFGLPQNDKRRHDLPGVDLEPEPHAAVNPLPLQKLLLFDSRRPPPDRVFVQTQQQEFVPIDTRHSLRFLSTQQRFSSGSKCGGLIPHDLG